MAHVKELAKNALLGLNLDVLWIYLELVLACKRTPILGWAQPSCRWLGRAQTLTNAKYSSQFELYAAFVAQVGDTICDADATARRRSKRALFTRHAQYAKGESVRLRDI